jgi:hypothetical protein
MSCVVRVVVCRVIVRVVCVEEQRATFVMGGYYSMKVPAATGLRIIALNTVLYSINFVPSNSTALGSPQMAFFFFFFSFHSFWLTKIIWPQTRTIRARPTRRPTPTASSCGSRTNSPKPSSTTKRCVSCRVVSCRVVSCRVVSCAVRAVRVVCHSHELGP